MLQSPRVSSQHLIGNAHGSGKQGRQVRWDGTRAHQAVIISTQGENTSTLKEKSEDKFEQEEG